MNMILQYVIPPFIIFIAGYLFLRIAGKKAVSEMNNFDLLFLLVVGQIISQPLTSQNIWQTIYYGFVFVLFYVAFSFLILNRFFRAFLIPKSTVLIKNGQINEQGLKRARITIDELLATLRANGYTKTADIEMAAIENIGRFSLIPKAHVRPLQPVDIQLQPSPTFIPIPIIIDGTVIEENLAYLQKDMEWLENQLNAWGKTLKDKDSISLAVYNEKGCLEVDEKQ
jgi:uncharacterized membrane protein YcaP (DUF421 family)